MAHNLFNTLQEFSPGSGRKGKFYSLPALEKAGIGKISRLPVSIRIVLESVLRNFDAKKIRKSMSASSRPGHPTPRAPRKFLLSLHASYCRTSLGCRCLLTSLPCAEWRLAWAKTRS